AYSLVLDEGVVNTPLLGVGAYDSSSTAFTVVQSLTNLNLTSSYNAVTHELRAVVLLTTNDSVPVVNETVSLYVQPDLDVALNNRGWICLGQSMTDANGTALFDVAVNAKGGAYGLQARFAGDNNFEASTSQNATRFVEVSPAPLLHIVNVQRVKNAVTTLLQVTDTYGFPLGGRLIKYEDLTSGEEPVYAISNGTGYATITFNVNASLSLVNSRLTVLTDPYTSELQALATLNLTGLNPSFEAPSGTTGAEGLILGAAAKAPADNASIMDSPTSPASAGLNQTAVKSAVVHAASDLPSISVSLNKNPAEADLPETFTVQFESSTYLGAVQFNFYENDSKPLGSAGATEKTYRFPNDNGGFTFIYNYSGSLVWEPDYYGGCWLFVNATNSGGLVAQGSSASFVINPAPVNLVVYYPGTFCGDTLDLFVGLSRSTVYDPESSGFYECTTLAPNIQWAGNTYMLDCGDNSTLIYVYVNGSETIVSPNPQCFSTVQTDLSPLGSGGCLNVTAFVNGTSRFEAKTVTDIFNLTETNVSDVPSAGSGNFDLNYSLSVSDGNETTYYDTQNSVNVTASLFDSPVYNASATVTTAKLLSRSATNSTGWASIPSGCNYLRVQSACLLQPNMASPLADVDHSGFVNQHDEILVMEHENSTIGDSLYDWRYDLNGDGAINLTDQDIVTASSNWGHSITYLVAGNCTGSYNANYDFSGVEVDFNTGQRAYLDSLGFTSVPAGAQWLNMSIGGVVEFFNAQPAQNASTDNVGVASIGWRPEIVGLDVVQAKLPSTFNVTVSKSASQPNYAEVNASLNVANYFYVLKRPVDITVNLKPLNASYPMGESGNITMSELDQVTGQPVPYLPFNLSVSSPNGNVNDTWSEEGTFDGSGTNETVCPMQGNFIYNVNVSWADFGDNAAGACSSLFDFRWPTNITSEAGNVTNASEGENETLYFLLTNGINGARVGGEPICFDVNGSYCYCNGTSWPFSGVYYGTTVVIGAVEFNWTVPPYGSGTYDVTAMFNGDTNYCPCQTSMIVNASAVPLGVLFSVTPDEFENGTNVLLNATIIDPSTGAPFTSQNVNVNFYNVDSNGVQQKLGTNSTGNTGMAFWSLNYASNGNAYAYKADINADSVSGVLRQGIASSPIQLTVGNATVLLLNVSRGISSTNHTIESQLLSDGTGVPNETVTITVNGQSFQNKTDPNGYFNVSIDLEPECPNGTTAYQNVTYTITASFAGDNPSNATAYDNTLDGSSYAECTTTQYCYEPSTNTTALTVNPQSTQATTATETPKQMQQDAKSNGCLSVYSEWSWWYPWYRLHFKITISDPTTIDVGVSFLPGGSTQSSKGLGIFNQLDEEFVKSFVIDTGTLMGEYALAKIGFWFGQPWVVAGAFVAEVAEDGFILGYFWNNGGELLAFGIVNIIMGLLATQGNFAASFLNLLTMVTTATMAALLLITTGAIASGGSYMWNPVNPFQVGLSFACAALALGRWAGL
ncbi:MAG: hypothetical protein WCD81_05195, partial [Candidatus Bathyarchaeia archaeon]